MPLDKTDLKAIGRLIDKKLESQTTAFDKKLDDQTLLFDKKLEGLAIMTAKGFEDMGKRFKRVDKRFEQVDKRFDTLEDRLDTFEYKTERGFDRMQDEIVDIKTRLNNIEKRLGLSKDNIIEIQELRKRVEVLEEKLRVA